MKKLLVSETNCYLRKRFLEKIVAIDRKKSKFKMNKEVLLGFSILKKNKKIKKAKKLNSNV